MSSLKMGSSEDNAYTPFARSKNKALNPSSVQDLTPAGAALRPAFALPMVLYRQGNGGGVLGKSCRSFHEVPWPSLDLVF